MDAEHRDDAVSLSSALRSSTTLRIKGVKLIDWLAGRIVLPWIRPASPPTEPLIPSRIRRILVIRPGGIGDAVLLIPFLRVLKGAFAHATVDVLAERRNADVFLLASDAFDALYCYDRHGAAAWRRLRRQRYDLVFDTEQWHGLSALMAVASGAPIRVGFDTNPARRHCYTVRVPYAHETYEGISFLRLLEAVTGRAIEEDWNRPLLSPPAPLQQWAEDYLHGRRVIAISVRGGIRERDWGSDNLQQLIVRLNAVGFTACLMGGRGDRSCAARICRGLASTEVINCVGECSLAHSAALIQKCLAWIGPDSGFMHVAYGVGTPVVALFGASSEPKWAPRGQRHRVINHHLPCSPCTRFAYTPRCPIHVRCLQEIAPEEVFRAVQDVLAAPASDDA